MRKKRHVAAAVQLDGWWMVTGGYGGGTLKSTEVFDADYNAFLDYVELPEKTSGHSILKLNQTHFVLVTTTNFYLFNM